MSKNKLLLLLLPVFALASKFCLAEFEFPKYIKFVSSDDNAKLSEQLEQLKKLGGGAGSIEKSYSLQVPIYIADRLYSYFADKKSIKNIGVLSKSKVVNWMNICEFPVANPRVDWSFLCKALGDDVLGQYNLSKKSLFERAKSLINVSGKESLSDFEVLNQYLNLVYKLQTLLILDPQGQEGRDAYEKIMLELDSLAKEIGKDNAKLVILQEYAASFDARLGAQAKIKESMDKAEVVRSEVSSALNKVVSGVQEAVEQKVKADKESAAKVAATSPMTAVISGVVANLEQKTAADTAVTQEAETRKYIELGKEEEAVNDLFSLESSLGFLSIVG